MGRGGDEANRQSTRTQHAPNIAVGTATSLVDAADGPLATVVRAALSIPSQGRSG
jgi:hypothetical protein